MADSMRLAAACAVALAIVLIGVVWMQRESSDGFRRGYGGRPRGYGGRPRAYWGRRRGVRWGAPPRVWGPSWWDSSSCGGCGAACDRADPAFNPGYCAYCATQCPMSARF